MSGNLADVCPVGTLHGIAGVTIPGISTKERMLLVLFKEIKFDRLRDSEIISLKRWCKGSSKEELLLDCICACA